MSEDPATKITPEAGRPWIAGLASGIGVVLLAGLLLAIVDVIHAGGAPIAVAGFWALLAVPLALGSGIVLAGGNAQWGAGWLRRLFRRLREDDKLDRAVAGAAIAAGLLAIALVFGISKLALSLLGEDVQRKAIGAKLLGAAVVAAIPVVALLAIPLYRGTRHLAVIVPPIGIPRVLVLVLATALVGVAAVAFIIYTQLDHQSMPISSYVVVGSLPLLAIVIAILASGPLAHVRGRIKGRAVIALVGLVVAMVLPAVGLRKPSQGTRLAVENASFIGPLLVPMIRKRIDRDGDGKSPFFGGPDCDDSDPGVYEGATEIAENGKDDNCIGGDGKREVLAAPRDVPKTTLTGGKNLVIIFIDTLRHDRLGFTGYQRDGKSLTPNIDKLAAQSIVFERAFAQAPNTPRSVPSFLGSRYPTQIAFDKKRRTNYPTVLDENLLLFEVMQPAGFRTIGMTSHFYFCDRVKQPDTCQDVFKSMASNIQQGAVEWDNKETVDIGPSNKDISGPRIVKKTVARLEELAKADQKFAMLIHLAEPHSTYMIYDEHPITERGDAALSQRYDYEILQVDKRVGELLESLDKTGLAKTTTVVLLSDHGEAFGVHKMAGQRMFFHGQTLYRELIHVPLIWRVPGATPRKATDVVMLLDLAPTIADLFDLEVPPAWQGRSLVPAIEGKALEPKPAYAELVAVPDWEHESRSMITGDGKHHVLFNLRDWEIYDLEADAAETTNLEGKDSPDGERMKEQLTRWIERGQ